MTPDSPETPRYRCGNCKYAMEIEGSPFAFCRRFPPTIYQSEREVDRDEKGLVRGVKQTFAQFPVVKDINWCGEHKTRPEGRATANVTSPRAPADRTFVKADS